MKLSYMIHKFRFILTKNGFSRGDYLRKKKLLKSIGENVFFQPRVLPGEPHLIKLHDNVTISKGVVFCTHDVMHHVFNYIEKDTTEFHMGCVEVMENVYIGMNTVILPNVRIGKNSIIGAGSIVTKDIPEGVVASGIPAKVMGKTFEDVRNERIIEAKSNSGLSRDEICEKLWDEFIESRVNK